VTKIMTIIDDASVRGKEGSHSIKQWTSRSMRRMR
jgi:hypothetical protein